MAANIGDHDQIQDRGCVSDSQTPQLCQRVLPGIAESQSDGTFQTSGKIFHSTREESGTETTKNQGLPLRV